MSYGRGAGQPGDWTLITDPKVNDANQEKIQGKTRRLRW